VKSATIDAFAQAQLKALGIVAEPRKEDAAYDAILAHCKKHKRPMRNREICEATGITSGSIGWVTGNLIQARRIVRVGTGQYVPVVTQ
jgi:hypothetical protein